MKRRHPALRAAAVRPFPARELDIFHEAFDRLASASVDFADPEFSLACAALSSFFESDTTIHWDAINACGFSAFLASLAFDDRILRALPAFLRLLAIITTFPLLDATPFADPAFFTALFDCVLPCAEDPSLVVALLHSLFQDDNTSAVLAFLSVDLFDRFIELFDRFPAQVSAVAALLISGAPVFPAATDFLTGRLAECAAQPPEFFGLLEAAVSHGYDLPVDDGALLALLAECDGPTAASIARLFALWFERDCGEMLTAFSWSFFERQFADDAPDCAAIAACELARAAARHARRDSFVTAALARALLRLSAGGGYAVKSAALAALIVVAETRAPELLDCGYLALLAEHFGGELTAAAAQSLLLLVIRALDGDNDVLIKAALLDSGILEAAKEIDADYPDERAWKLSRRALELASRLFESE
jgi:hypothetical protein